MDEEQQEDEEGQQMAADSEKNNDYDEDQDISVDANAVVGNVQVKAAGNDEVQVQAAGNHIHQMQGSAISDEELDEGFDDCNLSDD